MPPSRAAATSAARARARARRCPAGRGRGRRIGLLRPLADDDEQRIRARARRPGATPPRARRRSCRARARRRRRPSAARAGASAAAVNAERSLYVGKLRVAGSPRASSIRLDVKRESARVASARPDRLPRDPLGRARDQLPGRRAVEAGEGAPVAVHLDDHGRRRPESAAGQRCRADERVGGDDRVRPERADLPADAPRQGEVEAEPSAARAGRRARSGRRRRAPASGAEDAEVELAGDRVPFRSEPGRKRQRQPVPAGEEHAASAHRHAAASSRSCSSRP